MARNGHPFTDQGKANEKTNFGIQDYYDSRHTRCGYRLVLSDRRHFGYYPNAKASCFPILPALRTMEERIYRALGSPMGSRLLDAGCGTGHTALYMASAGNNAVEGVDIVERHILRAQRSIKRVGMEGRVAVRVADYHSLTEVEDCSYDGVYAIESLVHSAEPLKALTEFFRLLQPGGRICLNVYDREPFETDEKSLRQSVTLLSLYAGIPEESSFEKDTLQKLLAQAGFQEIRLQNMSENVTPMLRLFYRMGCIPFAFIPLSVMARVGYRFGRHFVNIAAGVKAYQHRDLWRYIMVTASKPNTSEQNVS